MKVQFTPEEIEMLSEFAKAGVITSLNHFPNVPLERKDYCDKKVNYENCSKCYRLAECKEFVKEIKENEELDKLDKNFKASYVNAYFKGKISFDKRILSKALGCEEKDIILFDYNSSYNESLVVYKLSSKS